jgi:hypothetical protein
VTPTVLTNPGIYTATASSTFPGLPVDRIFDASNPTDWAIDGFAGHNSQGRDEGWISATLDKSYLITHLRFAPRKPTGATDSIDKAYIWVSNAPFGVNVTSIASTLTFLGTSAGGAPNLTIGPFATFDDVDYPLASTLTSKYLLARFVNTSDNDSNRNLGVRTLLIGQIGFVPEPSTFVLVALSGLLTQCTRRRKRLEKDRA